MKKLYWFATIFWSVVIGISTSAVAAPFAMPPYYNDPNENRYPFYGDVSPTLDDAIRARVERANAAG